MDSFAINGFLNKDKFRYVLIDSTNLSKEAQKKQGLYGGSAIVLSYLLTATELLSAALLKDKQTMTVKLRTNGLIRGALIDADDNGHVKGYILNNHADFILDKDNKVDWTKMIGSQGTLSVSKNLGVGEPYTGQVSLVNGKIGETFAYYLAQSEQINSALNVVALIDSDGKINHAGGFLIQTLPGTSDSDINELEQKIKSISLSSWLKSGKDINGFLNQLVDGRQDVKALGTKQLSYYCNCSKEKFANDLKRLSENDLKELIDDDKGAELVCHFCNQKYNFTTEELKQILDSKSNN